MKTNPTRALAVAAGLVIVALTAAAFWLSYAHLAEVALAHGMEDKAIRAWAWPATLDLFIVAGELLMLRAALAGRVDVWAIGLTVVGSGSSIALNVAGVGAAAEPLDYVVAAVPPTAALLAFGALMRQIHQALAGQVYSETTPAEVTGDVTVERVDDDQERPVLEAARPLPEVVPAGARMLPLVARPQPAEVTTGEPPMRYRWDTVRGRLVDIEPVGHGDPWTNKKPDWTTTIQPSQVTTPVPAETPRQVVTEVIALTPAELRRRASRMHKEAVTSGRRGVTIDELREAFGLSRRDATELRRQVVTEGAS